MECCTRKFFLTVRSSRCQRDTGANQTVAQVGMLGPLRWFKDVPPPAESEPLVAWLADAAYAAACTLRQPQGPVQASSPRAGKVSAQA